MENRIDETRGLFTAVIDGWNSWGRVYQSIGAFAPLVRHILKTNGLPAAPIRHLTPGTNAVFRAGEAVVKIFAPDESAIQSGPALAAELAGLLHAGAAGVPVPRVLAVGEVRDAYRFPYLVLSLVHGREAGGLLPALPAAEKADFARRLRALTERLNTPPAAAGAEKASTWPQGAPAVPYCLEGNLAANRRWSPFPPALRRQSLALAQALPAAKRVFVHGDLTGENVLLDGDGRVLLLDFGDCQLAPPWYEWPPLCFALFGLDSVLLDAYFGAGVWRAPAFADTLARAVALHDFGGDFALRLCEQTGTPPAAVAGLAALRALVEKCLPTENTGPHN